MRAGISCVNLQKIKGILVTESFTHVQLRLLKPLRWKRIGSRSEYRTYGLQWSCSTLGTCDEVWIKYYIICFYVA